MEKYRVSVIVAIYNSEPFLEKCISSIIEQSYKNLEIILVNDGSPDNSGKICDDFAKNDNRIKVIHKKNGGACEARNYGLSASTGDYIVIVDGDDWLAKDYVEYFMNIIEKTGAEMAMSDNIFTTRNQVQVKEDTIEVLSAEKATIQIIYPRIPIGPWNKIYSSKLLKENNITFCVPWSGEGLHFSVTAAQHCSKVGVGHRKVYNYRLNNLGSGLTNYNINMGINALENIKLIGQQLIIKTIAVENAVNWHIWKNYNFLLKLIIATDSVNQNKEMYLDCKKNIKKRMFSTMIKSDLTVKEKIKIFIISLFPVLYAKRRIFKEKTELQKDNMK